MRCFDSIIGQDRAIAGLRRSLQTARISNGYLFCGMAGVGRRSLLEAFAAALLCRAGGPEPCGECESCRLFDGGAHSDLVTLDPEGDVITIDMMRELCQQIAIRPGVSPRRVACVPDAGRMNDMAANCFLKTLEEPPGAAVLLLTALSTDSLPRTIVSRCQVVRLGCLTEDAVVEVLVREKGLSPEDAGALAALADGSPGRALSLSGTALADDWNWLTGALRELRPAGAFAFAETLIERAQRDGKDAPSVRMRSAALLELAMFFYRKELRGATASRGLLMRMESVGRSARQLTAFVKAEIVLRALALSLAHGGRRFEPEER